MNHGDTEARRAELNRLTERVIGLCIEVHRTLGPGLLESVYEEALAYEMGLARLNFARQAEFPLRYKEVVLTCGYRLDFLVDGKLIIELKAVNAIEPIHQAQLLTYLKFHRLPLGLLVNFNVPVLKDGIRRIVSGDLFRTRDGLDDET
ncbi:MAG: GxxExxY protein [Verrucomicrobia bacterium]|nr:GxxExxY protein [Verrucomicrobiota bacterium]